MLRIWSEQLKALAEELRTLEEQEQHEELAVRALRILAVRALLRNLALRALLIAKVSAEAAAAESSLNFLSASLVCLASLAWRLAHSLG